MIRASEHSMIGGWEVVSGRVEGDAICARIEVLVSVHLVKLGYSPDGWSTLYRDPNDDRLWERFYPKGEMHGGGPPALRVLSDEQARAKFGFGA